jgi:hypothetical protein
MKLNRILSVCIIAVITFSLAMTSCQKLERPLLKELILDPPPPPYTPLKSFWSFENNTGDSGSNLSAGTEVKLTYEPGINGQALRIGEGGYLLIKEPGDSIVNLGSFTLSFWMNGVGPVKDGAQGLFAISNKNEFWGNLELFLENNDNPADQNEAFLKIHMFNAGVAEGNGEEWNEIKIPNALNKWTHIAVTYDAATSQFSVYVDGQPTSIANKKLGGGTYGKIKFNDVNGMVLGTYQFQTSPSLTNHGPEDWAKSFNGLLDQFRIYNQPLSAAEITDLFTSKK